jgi:light-regulated signal transduction histidine kinase (bacteriophytochrome)
MERMLCHRHHQVAHSIILARGKMGADTQQPAKLLPEAPQWATSTGLGLYIAKQLTEAMNGSLELARRKDGSSFLVNLQLSHQLSLFEL